MAKGLHNQGLRRKVAAGIQDKFNLALNDAVESGRLTAETMRAVSEAIKSIPTSWSTTYEVRGAAAHNYTDALPFSHQGRIPTYHQGHVPVFHEGYTPGMFEMLGVFDTREAIIRASSVNRETLPALNYIQRTGQAPPARQPAAAQPVNVHIQIVGQDGRTLRKYIFESMKRGWGPVRVPSKIEMPF